MPNSITDVPTFTTTIQTVADGDSATAANFALAPQGLANRTAYLRNQTEVAGVPSIRTVANATALTAVSSPADGSVCRIAGNGLYYYSAASALTVDGVLVINGPSGVGRWLLDMRALANATSGYAMTGVAAGGTAGKVPVATVPNCTISSLLFSMQAAGNGPGSTLSAGTSYSTMPGISGSGPTLSVPNALAGDFIEVEFMFSGYSSSAAGGFIRLQVVDGANTSYLIAGESADMGAFTNVDKPTVYRRKYTVVNGGTVVITAQWKSNNTSDSLSNNSATWLATRLVRP